MTKVQLRELHKLAKEKQNTYGSARARTQNTLVELGFARHVEDGFACEITEAGRAALKETK